MRILEIVKELFVQASSSDSPLVDVDTHRPKMEAVGFSQISSTDLVNGDCYLTDQGGFDELKEYFYA